MNINYFIETCILVNVAGFTKNSPTIPTLPYNRHIYTQYVIAIR